MTTGARSAGAVLAQALVDAARDAVAERAIELARPLFVTQRSVEAVVGLPRRAYLRAARAGAFATTKEGKAVLARTADVATHYERRLATRATPANDTSGDRVDRALARVGARRVGGAK